MQSLADTREDINRLRLVLVRLARRIRSNAPGDITPSQTAVLFTLARHGSSTIGHIADHEHVQPPSASKIVAGLEARGLVERSADPDDRRCALIGLSPEGHRYVAQIRAAGASWLASRLDTLDHDDQAAIIDALPALERLLGGSE